MTKILNLGVSTHIEENFREYAIYTLENRGIPNFYDSLTNVQRIILHNAPKTFNKTMSLIGAAISSGYHHGDSSLEGAINRLAKTWGCSHPILEGDGFFGTQVNQEAAAARYTSIKINQKIKEIIQFWEVINEKNIDGVPAHFNLPVPIGLLTTTIGISVGYKTLILPRRLEDIIKPPEEAKPFFMGFDGEIEKVPGRSATWILSGLVEKSTKDRTISIEALPPLMRYDKFLQKIDRILDEYDYQLENSSRTDVQLEFRFNNLTKQTCEEVYEKIRRATKIQVTESVIYIKDGKVFEYSSVDDYLKDFFEENEFRKLRFLSHQLNELLEEKVFNESKLEYLQTFLKHKYASTQEILDVLSRYPKPIQDKLKTISLLQLSNEELQKTRTKIKELTEKIADKTERFNKQQEKTITLTQIKKYRNTSPKEVALDIPAYLSDVEVFDVETF